MLAHTHLADWSHHHVQLLLQSPRQLSIAPCSSEALGAFVVVSGAWNLHEHGEGTDDYKLLLSDPKYI